MKKSNISLEELEMKKKNLEKENEYLKIRKMDIELYRKAFEKYTANPLHRKELTYDKLYNHPEYYTKWRNTFFDTQIKLIESGIYVEDYRFRTDRTLEEIQKTNERKRECEKDIHTIRTTHAIVKNQGDNMKYEEYMEARKHSSSYLYSPAEYEQFLDGICKFSELKLDVNNPSKERTYLDVDHSWIILGYCDSVKAVDGKYQLHLIDPYGECLFSPFDITPEEAELALGRICVVHCAYNHYASEPKLLDLQILPFTLTEKLGEYTKDTVVIRRYPKLNYQPFAWLQ